MYPFNLLLLAPVYIPTHSGVTDGRQEGEPPPPPGGLNVKTGPPSAEILVFTILLIFSRLLFFCVF